MREPERTDSYLYTPGALDLGIKIREGRIEIKQRTQVVGLHKFTTDFAGIVECWDKWGFAIDAEEPSMETLSETVWIPVKKKRVIRRYQVYDQHKLRAIPGWLYPVNRSSIEIADITINHNPWWGLNFEVVGVDIDLREALMETANTALQKNGFPILKAECSYCYPQWFDNLFSKD
jgi:hypothetical protein